MWPRLSEGSLVMNDGREAAYIRERDAMKTWRMVALEMMLIILLVPQVFVLCYFSLIFQRGQSRFAVEVAGRVCADPLVGLCAVPRGVDSAGQGADRRACAMVYHVASLYRLRVSLAGGVEPACAYVFSYSRAARPDFIVQRADGGLGLGATRVLS